MLYLAVFRSEALLQVDIGLTGVVTFVHHLSNTLLCITFFHVHAWVSVCEEAHVQCTPEVVRQLVGARSLATLLGSELNPGHEA